jgi:hypothetical protein
VFVARGGGSGLLPLELAADERISLVPTPRHASVLLAAGRFPGALGAALDRVHDQLPHPRCTVWWTVDDDDSEPPAALERAATVLGDIEAVCATVVHAHRARVTEDLVGDADVLADVPPHEFEGRGDHGQGGEGMMGGVPFGRPMAMTAEDRDGLALDRLDVTFGPFLWGLPNAVRVHASLQGGVVQDAQLDLLDVGDGPTLDRLETIGDAAAARHRLRWLTGALLLGGLPALASRAARLARASGGSADRARLDELVRRSGLLAAWRGVGTIGGEDARMRLERSLSDPAWTPGPATFERIAPALVGQDWADALVTIWSLDLDADRTRSDGRTMR